MSFATANGVSLLAFRIVRPVFGAWVADILLDSPALPSGPMALDVGGVRFESTVFRNGISQETAYARLYAGKGGLANVVGPRAYRNAPAVLVLDELLRAAGEARTARLPAVLGERLDTWVRTEGSAGVELARLCHRLAIGWRVEPNGLVSFHHAGKGPALSLPPEAVLVDLPAQGTLELTVDRPTAEPGVVLPDGRRVTKVLHELSEGRYRDILCCEPS